MEDKGFNLSEKIGFYESGPFGAHAYLDEDVKEFIRLLKERLNNKHKIQDNKWLFQEIDKLAGEKLR